MRNASEVRAELKQTRPRAEVARLTADNAAALRNKDAGEWANRRDELAAKVVALEAELTEAELFDARPAWER